MKIMDYMVEHGYEQVVFCQDQGAALKAIIAIHDTTLGPALGGCRMWPYASEEAAVTDVLRLARAMTYKAAGAGLALGGGKAVVIADPARDKTEALFRALGRFVQALGGRYITTEDVGTTERDMQHIRTETRFVTGLPIAQGGSGDPSPATGLGIYQGMKACAKEAFGSPDLKGKAISIQGVGKVGYYLARHLHQEGARLTVADLNAVAAQRAAQEFGASVVAPEAIYDVPCDIFAPCALGAVLNDDTIPRLKCRVVAGGANNQLAEERHGDELARRSILYAPDYILNAGGLINLSFEFPAYNAEAARAKVMEVYATMERVIALAKAQKTATSRAADKLAQDRIDAVRKLRKLYPAGA